MPPAAFSAYSPSCRLAIEHACSTTSRPRPTSPSASGSVLPCSRVIISASLPVFSRSSCCSFSITRMRAPCPVLRQVWKASLALDTARSSSSRVANGTRATTCWVAGSITSRHSEVLDSISLPPINSGTVGTALMGVAPSKRRDAAGPRSRPPGLPPAAALRFQQRAGGVGQRLEGLFGGNRGNQLGIIPAALGFTGLFHFVQIHVVDHPPIRADAGVAHDRIFDRQLAHLVGDHLAVGAARGGHGAQIVQHAGIHARLRHGRLQAAERLF